MSFTVDLSEVVTVSGGVPTLTLNDGGTATYVSGSGTGALVFAYTVTAGNSNVASLAATAVNLNGATIANGANAQANLSLSGVTQSGPQINTAPHHAITTTPSITESPATGDLGVGKTVTFTVDLGTVVTISGGVPTLTLNDGGTATYVSGSGTDTLVFAYTVAAGNSNVASLAATAANLNGATIANSANAQANLARAAMTQSGPQIDTTTPSITAIAESPATGDLGVGKTVSFTVDLSDAVTVSGGAPTLTLNDGGTATYVSGSGTRALVFAYTVMAGNSNVASLAATAVNLNGATIANGASAKADLSLIGRDAKRT